MEVMKMVAARLKERSTWMGLIALAGVVGVSTDTATMNAVVEFGIAAASLVLVLTADKPKA